MKLLWRPLRISALRNIRLHSGIERRIQRRQRDPSTSMAKVGVWALVSGGLSSHRQMLRRGAPRAHRTFERGRVGTGHVVTGRPKTGRHKRPRDAAGPACRQRWRASPRRRAAPSVSAAKCRDRRPDRLRQRGLCRSVQAALDPVSRTADDEGEHARPRTAARRGRRRTAPDSGIGVQRHHRQCQPCAGAMQIHGDDGLVAQRRRAGRPCRARDSAHSLAASVALQARTTASKGLPSSAPIGRTGIKTRHALRGCEPARRARRARQPPAPARARSAAAPGSSRSDEPGAAEQGVAQHAQEHLRTGLRGGRVQRGDAQRLDELRPHDAGRWRHSSATLSAGAQAKPAAAQPRQRPAATAGATSTSRAGRARRARRPAPVRRRARRKPWPSGYCSASGRRRSKVDNRHRRAASARSVAW